MISVDQIFKMENPIQHYAWGSRTAIAELMGQLGPTEKPQAELWMGAHPKAPSRIWYGEQWHPLDQIIAQYPKEMIGVHIAGRYDNQMPYLFKVLAAGEPLSIQAHPDMRQARIGFQRENQIEIPIDAPNRNYKDDRHKPESMCALTTFWGLCGFRTLTDIMSFIKAVWPSSFNHLLTVLTQSYNPKGLELLFGQLMRLEEQQRMKLVDSVVDKSVKLEHTDQAFEWIIKLNKRYPGDIGVLSPILLNIIKLEPGEAIFLPARQLHAYLDGLGIELMANSDNVLRGGLTAKYVDVDELITILDFKPYRPEKLTHLKPKEGETIYNCPAEEFMLSELVTNENQPFHIEKRINGPEIILSVAGSAQIVKGKGPDVIHLDPGQSVFVPSLVDGYTIEGNAKLFRASANLRNDLTG